MKEAAAPDSRWLVSWLLEESRKPDFSSFISGLLFDLCALPSVPSGDIDRTAAEENAVFDRLAKALASNALHGRVEMRPMDESIAADPRYTKPYYTDDPRPYRGRSNMVHVFEPERGRYDGHAGPSLALNAHIDTVAPFFPPVFRGESLYARGACDDKGCCVAIAGASVLLERLRKALGIAPRGRVVSMYVIEEETGGNGSLSLAMDKEISALWDSIVVAESTEGQIHPANRGAVWYKAELGEESMDSTLFALRLVRAFESSGRALREGCSHPLFPTKPMHTCHGILGAYGEHPSRICGRVEFTIRLGAADRDAVARAAEKGLAGYISVYGDRTKEIDPVSGKPKIDRHYELSPQDGGFLLRVFGTTGHMGASLENDNAITKASYLVPEIAAAGSMEISLAKSGSGPLILEGGQGFLPTHEIGEIEAMMKKAAEEAYAKARTESAYRGPAPRLTFDKLHNDAFARDSGSVEMLKAIEAARLAGIGIRMPLSGFSASCDARLFAHFHRDRQVLTAGPGSIRFAHADDEHIDLPELGRSCAFFAMYILLFTGTAEIA